MATGTRFILSSSTGGEPIQIAQTGTPGTPLHTSDATDDDELYLVAYNTDTVDRDITIEWGGTGAGNELGPVTIPSKSFALVVPGIGIGNSKAVAAYASVTNQINIVGHVNRITN